MVIVGLLAGLRVVLHLVLAERYGYAAEELLVLACSDRLAWGYVDVTPTTAHLTLLGRIFHGSSLFAIRIAPALAGGALVVLGASLVRRLGGGRFAVSFAALCLALSPPLLAAGSTLTTLAFAPLTALILVSVFVGLVVDERSRRGWLIGPVAAVLVGLDPRAAVFVAAALVSSLLTTPAQRRGGTPYWLGLALGAVYAGPILGWQAAHAWPAFEATALPLWNSTGALATALLAWSHVVFVPFWLAGGLALVLSPRLAAARPVGFAVWAWAFAALTFAWPVEAASFLLPVLLVGGAVHFEAVSAGRLLARLRAPAVLAVLAVGVLATPLVVPLLPIGSVPAYAAWAGPLIAWPQRLESEPTLPPRFAAMLGWKERVAIVRRVLDGVPPKERSGTALWVRDRVEAAAFDRFGSQHGLPRPVSPDGDYARWGTGLDEPKLVLAVGFAPAEIEPLFRRQCTRVVEGCASCPEARREIVIHLCTAPRAAAAVLLGELAGTLERATGIE